MWQTLFYIPEQLWGWPVVHIMIALWAIACVVFLLSSLRDQERWRDFLGYVPMLAVFGAAIYFALPNLMEPGVGDTDSWIWCDAVARSGDWRWDVGTPCTANGGRSRNHLFTGILDVRRRDSMCSFVLCG